MPGRTQRTLPPPPSFSDFVRARRPDVERALDAWLPTPPACHASIANAIRYAVGSRGKRIRPLLTLASAEAVASAGTNGEPVCDQARRLAMPAACAAELIHTQSLVHDDLPAMDDDSMRRGQPTVHVRYGEAIAILAGDAMLVEAFGLLARNHDGYLDAATTAQKLRTVAVFAEAIGVRGMAGGQAVNLALTGSARPAGPACAVAEIWDLHRRKTGCLFRAAAASGAILAGGSDAEVDAAAAFAERIGIAFQIADDILDVEGSAQALGKTPGKDVRAGKPTFAAVAGVEHARTVVLDTVTDAIAALELAGLATPAMRGLAWAAISRVAGASASATGLDRPWITADERGCAP